MVEFVGCGISEVIFLGELIKNWLISKASAWVFDHAVAYVLRKKQKKSDKEKAQEKKKPEETPAD